MSKNFHLNPAEVEAGRYQNDDEDVFKPSGDKKAQALFNRCPPQT